MYSRYIHIIYRAVISSKSSLLSIISNIDYHGTFVVFIMYDPYA